MPTLARWLGRGRDASRARTPGLVEELQRSARVTASMLLGVLVVSLLASGYFLFVSQPRITGLIDLARESRDSHEAMLDQETGLRGWLATGDRTFLEPYAAGRRHADISETALVKGVEGHPELTPAVLRMMLARQQWQGWAAEASRMRLTRDERVDGTLSEFLLDGKRLFDRYRAEQTRSTGLVLAERERALNEQTTALVLVSLCYVVGIGVTLVVAVRRRRELQTRIIDPVSDLHQTVVRLRSGDLSACAAPTAVPELAEIGSALGGLAGELAWSQIESAAREQRLTRQAERFETVVTVGREIAGSLSVRYVSGTVTTAAADLLGADTMLWLHREESFELVHRSVDPHRRVPPAGRGCDEVVARAAAAARMVDDGQRRAYPLVLAGRVTAVLEVATAAIDPDTDQVLTALLSTAAAALESAHLHSTAREQADLDGLTHLPNRRRFETDADVEWDRCRRYGRPLSAVMLDLDHFKRLNDEHGHQVGDEALRAAADAITGVLRTSDTAYRYGGEEFVVLLRETGLEDAAMAAERIRHAVGAVTLPGNPSVAVSVSAGVATRGATMAHHSDLVTSADQALYDAKRQGRNRVVSAGAAPAAPVALVRPEATPA